MEDKPKVAPSVKEQKAKANAFSSRLTSGPTYEQFDEVQSLLYEIKFRVEKIEARDKTLESIKKDIAQCNKNSVTVEQNTKSLIDEFTLKIDGFEGRVKEAELEASNSKRTAAYLELQFKLHDERIAKEISDIKAS